MEARFADATAAPPAADENTIWSKPTGSCTNSWRKRCRPSGAGWRKTGTSAREPKGSVSATSLRLRYDTRSLAVIAYSWYLQVRCTFCFWPKRKAIEACATQHQTTKPDAGTSISRGLPILVWSHGCQFNVDQPTTMVRYRMLERQRCGCCVLLCSSLCGRGCVYYFACSPRAAACSFAFREALAVLSFARMAVTFPPVCYPCRTAAPCAQLGHLKSLLDSKAGRDDLVSVARAMGDVEQTLAVVRESVPGGHALHELQARTKLPFQCVLPLFQ